MMCDNVKFIPIGSNCEISWYLKKINKRNEAYPFDWNCCSLSMLYNILINNFEDFLTDIFVGTKIKRKYFDENDNNLIVSNEEIYPVICKKYKILLPHDYKKIDNSTINIIREKYKKRINRLNNVINNDKYEIYLIYCNENFLLNEWQKSVYDEYNYDVTNIEENILDKIKKLFIHKPNIKILSLEQLKKMTL